MIQILKEEQYICIHTLYDFLIFLVKILLQNIDLFIQRSAPAAIDLVLQDILVIVMRGREAQHSQAHKAKLDYNGTALVDMPGE